MRSTSLLIKKLSGEFPQYSFEFGTGFLWSAKQKTIYIDPNVDNAQCYTLHELSHALLGHEGYNRDIELVKMERDAWQYAATTLAPRYETVINDTLVQENLDTYREWLHARSICPECNAVGVQRKGSLYYCLACTHDWRVNEARLCALRRYSLQSK